MCCARPLSSGPWSVSDVSAATRTRATKNGFFTHCFLRGPIATERRLRTSRYYWYFTGVSRFYAVRRCRQRRPDVSGVPEQLGAGGTSPARGQKESSFEGGGRSARTRLRVSIQSRAVGQQYDNGNISSRRQERFPGEVSVFSGAVPLRSVCRFAREAAVALLPARLWLSPWRSGLSDDVPRARRVRSALSGVAGTDHARPLVQGLLPATARRAALRRWRRRGRGHRCRVNHDYTKTTVIVEAPRGETRGSAPPARARARAGAASWYGSGVPPGAALGRRALSARAHAGRAAVAVVVELDSGVPHVVCRFEIED